MNDVSVTKDLFGKDKEPTPLDLSAGWYLCKLNYTSDPILRYIIGNDSYLLDPLDLPFFFEENCSPEEVKAVMAEVFPDGYRGPAWQYQMIEPLMLADRHMGSRT